MSRAIIEDCGGRGTWIGKEEALALIATLEFGERQATGSSPAAHHLRSLHRALEAVLQHLADNGGGMIFAEARDA